MAAAAAAARSVLRSSSVRNAASRLASQPKSAPSPFRLPAGTPLAQRLFRSPVELSACLESMQPYHTATASALMTSMLTVSRCGFGWLPEDWAGALFYGALIGVLSLSYLFRDYGSQYAGFKIVRS